MRTHLRESARILKTELPMPHLFQACHQVLLETCRPWHYKDLTRLALDDLGYQPTPFALSKNAENVREKLLCKQGYGMFYTEDPAIPSSARPGLAMGAMQHWFRGAQQMLSLDPLIIPGNATSGRDAAIEVQLRTMIQKNPLVSRETIARVRATGMVVEKHIAHWFQRNWPTFFHHPPNHQQWDQPCAYDFALLVNNQYIRIDVFTPNLDGSYGNKSGKRTTDFHLLCELAGTDVRWHTIMTGTEYQQDTPPAYGRAPCRLVVWLNCHRERLPYEAIAQSYRLVSGCVYEREIA